MQARVRAMRVMQKGKIKNKIKKKKLKELYEWDISYCITYSYVHPPFLIVFKPSFSRSDVYIRTLFTTNT